jgi:hypothetical protein
MLVERSWLIGIEPGVLRLRVGDETQVAPDLEKTGEHSWSFGDVSFDPAYDVEAIVLDEVGRPIPSAIVSCIPSAKDRRICESCFPSVSASCLSDDDGRCVVSCRAEGEIQAEPADASFTGSAYQVIQGRRAVVVRLERKGRVRGRCTMASTATASSWVSLWQDRRQISSSFCSGGLFEFDAVAPGEYVVRNPTARERGFITVLPGSVSHVVLAPDVER